MSSQATSHSQQRRDAPKIRRPLLILLICAAIIGFILAGIGVYSQWHPSQSQQEISQTEKAVTPPSETPQRPAPQQSQLVKKTGSKLKSYEQGFLAWEVLEQDLQDGRKQVKGTVRWNETSGAKGEPVRGMPLSLLAIHRAKKELDEIAKGNTDETGQFTFISPTTVETALIGTVEKAANLPLQVVAFLMRKERSPEDQRLIQTLDTLQQRVNTETAWGRKASQFLEQQHTSITADPSIPSAMQYVVSRDTILINPDQDPTTEEQVLAAREGHLDPFIMRFHEELHRSQENQSKWGELWRFLRQTHQMDTYFNRPGQASHEEAVRASKEQWLHLDHVLTGNTPLNPIDAANHLGQWRERMRPKKPERDLLKETHAYWISDVTTPSELYRHLLEHPLEGYAGIFRVDEAHFTHLCETMDLLDAAYDGDFDKLAAFVGNADSIADFEQKAKAVISSTDLTLLEQRREQMQREKQEWKETTARLAREVLR